MQFNGGSGNTLKLDASTMPTDTIFGFTNGDTIDLAALTAGNTSSVSIGAGNTLTIDETNGTTLALNLDPAQNFAGLTPVASSDGAGGTDISFGAPVPSQTFFDGGVSSNLVGNNGNDIFVGSTGNDTITTGTGHNLIGPGSGNDIILAHGSDVDVPRYRRHRNDFCIRPGARRGRIGENGLCQRQQPIDRARWRQRFGDDQRRRRRRAVRGRHRRP